jgi:hypothetical protein
LGLTDSVAMIRSKAAVTSSDDGFVLNAAKPIDLLEK